MQSIKKETRNHNTWLANYQGNSLNQYRRAWSYWTEYLGNKDESWIFENKDIEDWAAHLVNFHRWLKQKPKERGRGTLSDNTAKVLANGIRGYLKHIGIALGLTKVQKVEITNVESQPTLDYPFDLKTKESLLRVANPEEDYIVSAGVSFGLRVGDYRLITRGMLEPLLNKELPIQLPKIITKKEGIAAYPFIDKDAYAAIKRLLREMDIQGRVKPSDRMLNLTSRQIGDVLKELFRKAGINTTGYTIRFHILRKFITDKLAGICSSDKWKHFVGKKATSPYVTSEGIEAYTKVMEFTCVNHNKIFGTSDLAIKVENLTKELNDLKKRGTTAVHMLDTLSSGQIDPDLREYLIQIFAEIFNVDLEHPTMKELKAKKKEVNKNE